MPESCRLMPLANIEPEALKAAASSASLLVLERRRATRSLSTVPRRLRRSASVLRCQRCCY
eukprot:5280186-Alexandrium_andersonii.AAC.1